MIYPPTRAAKELHSQMININRLPWYILAFPFFSKMNDSEDSSFEFYAKRHYKYKPVKSSNIFKMIFKNLLMAFITLGEVLLNYKLIGRKKRILNSKSLIVDYYINKKNKNTILQPLNKKYKHSTVWVVGSKEGYDEILRNYTLFEIISFLYIQFISILKLPLVKIGFLNYLLELSRTLNSYYAFNYFLAGKDLVKFNIKELHFLYEDQLRDRMLLRENRISKTYGYIFTSLIHEWRPNKSFSLSDIYIPRNLIFNDINSKKNHLKNKFLFGDINCLVDSKSFFNELNDMEKLKILNSNNRKFILKKINIYFPNSQNLSKELINITQKLNKIFPNIEINTLFHPNLKNFYNKQKIKDIHLNQNSDLIISSHRTNKGYELSKKGFKVIYFGSDNFSFYNPIKNIKSEMIFASNSKILISIINNLLI